MSERNEIILEEIDTVKLAQEIKERAQEASNEEELKNTLKSISLTKEH